MKSCSGMGEITVDIMLYLSLIRFLVLSSSSSHLTWLEISLWSLLHCLNTTRLGNKLKMYETQAK